MRENNQNQKFPGFPPKPNMNFWSYPKDLNGYWHLLTGSEQKVLDYILRHTWGFDKVKDEISLSQMERGIKGFDKGTGLGRKAVIRAIKGLIKNGFVKKREGKRANCYELVLNRHHPSVGKTLVASVKKTHTIDNVTINNKQYGSSFKKKPYFRGNPMRWKKSEMKWYVIENDEWLEFAGSESEIDWK